MSEFLYRFDSYVSVDEYGYVVDRHTTLTLQKFKILKRTKCGVWIDSYNKQKFVNLERNKKFACATPEEALQSFIYRKKRQISILTSQLNEAEIAKNIAMNITVDELKSRVTFCNNIFEGFSS